MSRGAPGSGGKRVARAAQAPEIRGLDGLAQEIHVAVDLGLVEARAVEMRLGVTVGGTELLLQSGAGDVFVEARGLDDQVLGRGVAHHFVAVGQALARDLAPHEFLIEEFPALLQVHAIGHLPDQVGGTHQAAEHAVACIADRDLIDLHLVAGEMHQALGDRGLGRYAAMNSAPRLTWVLVNTAPFSTPVSAERRRYPQSCRRAISTPSSARRGPRRSRVAQARSWPSTRRAMASVMSSVWRMSW